MRRCALGLALLLPTSVVMFAAPRDAQGGEDAKSASSNTKSSNEPVGVNMDENIRLRRDLDEYSRSVDPAHVQIEERRPVMLCLLKKCLPFRLCQQQKYPHWHS